MCDLVRCEQRPKKTNVIAVSLAASVESFYRRCAAAVRIGADLLKRERRSAWAPLARAWPAPCPKVDGIGRLAGRMQLQCRATPPCGPPGEGAIHTLGREWTCWIELSCRGMHEFKLNELPGVFGLCMGVLG